jgi:hypothetical protein
MRNWISTLNSSIIHNGIYKYYRCCKIDDLLVHLTFDDNLCIKTSESEVVFKLYEDEYDLLKETIDVKEREMKNNIISKICK